MVLRTTTESGLRAWIKQLEADNAKLRTALEEILKADEEFCIMPLYAVEIAREALK